MNIDDITDIKSSGINRNTLPVSILSCFFMLLTANSFQIFPKYSGYGFTSDSFALS